LSKRLSSKAGLLFILGVCLGGCGMNTPLLEPGEENITNHVTGALVNKIVDHVKCELGQAILYEINYDRQNAALNNKPRNFTWLDTSFGTLTLTMTVDERSGLAPGATWTEPLAVAEKTAQSFGVELGATASTQATRKQQVDFVFDVKKDFLDNKAFRSFNDHGLTPAHCNDEDGRMLIEGNLRIQEWLDSSLFPRDISGNVDRDPPDVLTNDVTFIVTFSGSATPSWKLVRWSVNSSTPLATAARVRTNEALIALGPAGKPGAKGKATGPSQSVIEFRNIALIGSVINISNLAATTR
jgi:hypothetical protein